MSKRMLMVYNVNGVKNLMHQITSSKKRKKLGTDLFTEQEEAIDDSLDANQYLDRLHTSYSPSPWQEQEPLPPRKPSRKQA